MSKGNEQGAAEVTAPKVQHTAEFAAKVARAIAVLTHKEWRSFDKSTVAAAWAIVRTAGQLEAVRAVQS